MTLNTLLLHPAGFQYLFIILTLISSSPYYVGCMFKLRLHDILFEVMLSNLWLILRHYCIKCIVLGKTSFDLQAITFFAATSSSKANLEEC